MPEQSLCFYTCFTFTFAFETRGIAKYSKIFFDMKEHIKDWIWDSLAICVTGGFAFEEFLCSVIEHSLLPRRVQELF